MQVAPPNNGLHQTGGEGAAASRPILVARLAAAACSVGPEAVEEVEWRLSWR